SLQLRKAGVRLAAVVNKALASAHVATSGTSKSRTSTSDTDADADTDVSTTGSVPTRPTRNPTTQTSAGTDQFLTEAEARGHCKSETVVWANLKSSVYHFQGYPSYGTTKRGAYMCEAAATGQGMHAA